MAGGTKEKTEVPMNKTNGLVLSMFLTADISNSIMQIFLLFEAFKSVLGESEASVTLVQYRSQAQ